LIEMNVFYSVCIWARVTFNHRELVTLGAGPMCGSHVLKLRLQVQTMRVLANHQHVNNLGYSFSQQILSKQVFVFEHSVVDNSLAAFGYRRGTLVLRLWFQPLILLHSEEEA